MFDLGAPLVLAALGAILWLAVDATVAGLSIQTIGVILFIAGIAWLLVALVQERVWAGRRDTTVVREREVL
jgi:hypothetical protein